MNTVKLIKMDNQEIFETIFSPQEQEIKFGQVVCFSANHVNKTITETGRTSVMPFFDALNAYSEIPNPASQLLRWSTEEERTAAEAELQKNIKDPEWLEQLFECI